MPSNSRSNPPRIPFGEVLPILDVVATNASEPVLVGGQALNFWAEYYAHRLPALRAEQPFGSTDLDFVGGRVPRDAARVASALGGTLREAPIHYGRSIIAAQVTYTDGAGYTRDIQFLRRMGGLDVEAVILTASPLRPGLRVMNPLLCLESRLYNVLKLPEHYNNPVGLKQARLSILCGREFLLDMLTDGADQKVLHANKRIFQLARDNARRLASLDLHPFHAVISDPRLPAAFNELNYPRMKRTIEQAIQRRRPARDDRER